MLVYSIQIVEFLPNINMKTTVLLINNLAYILPNNIQYTYIMMNVAIII